MATMLTAALLLAPIVAIQGQAQPPTGQALGARTFSPPRVVEPAPQPPPVDSTGTPIEAAPAPARLIRARAALRSRADIPQEQRDAVLVHWGAAELGPVPEVGRVIVVLEPPEIEWKGGDEPLTFSAGIDAEHWIVAGAGFDGAESVVDLAAGDAWWPVRPEDLTGQFRAHAILDPLGSLAGLGDDRAPISLPVIVTFDSERADLIELTLTHRVPDAPAATDESEGIREISVAAGAHGVLRAAVVLPRAHPGDASAGVRWPVVLLLPDADESWAIARDLAPAIRSLVDAGMLPQALYAVIDTRTPFGHHALKDTDAHGPYESALAAALLPTLAETLGASTLAADRVVAGIGVGGFAALRLTAARPDLVSAAFVAEPMMPCDGRLGECRYAAPQHDAHGARSSIPERTTDQAAEVAWMGAGTHRVVTTIAEEAALERVLSTSGASGRWLDTWNALCSPTLAPGHRRPLVRADGVIDATAAAGWEASDLLALVDRSWADCAEPLSQSWALIPVRDRHLACDGAAAFFRWFDARCAEEARQGRSPPSGQGGVIEAGELPHDRRWMALLSVLGPRIRDHFRASLKP